MQSATACRKTALGGGARPSAQRRPSWPPRRAALTTTRALMSEVGQYLSEAATQAFRPTHESNVPWEGTAAPFAGAAVALDACPWIQLAPPNP